MNQIKERIILMCKVKHSTGKGSEDLCNTLEILLKEEHLSKKIKMVQSGYQDLHVIGPVIIVKPDIILYIKLESKDIKEIIKYHLIHNEIVESLVLKNPDNGEIIKDYRDAQIFI
jgi:(2Fe-2S) ferredoxin